jgi:hypothetical protein
MWDGGGLKTGFFHYPGVTTSPLYTSVASVVLKTSLSEQYPYLERVSSRLGTAVSLDARDKLHK